MNLIQRQLTIDDILNLVILPSDKNSFKCDVSENEYEIFVRISIRDVNKQEVSVNYKKGYLYINSFSREDNFIYDKGIYIGDVIKKSIKVSIEKNSINIIATKRKNRY